MGEKRQVSHAFFIIYINALSSRRVGIAPYSLGSLHTVNFLPNIQHGKGEKRVTLD